MKTAYNVIIYILTLIVLNCILTTGVLAQIPNPPNTEIGNILTNNLHKNIQYKFLPATSKPQPLKTFSSYGPTGMEKEVMGFAPYWDLSSGAYTSYVYSDLKTIAYFGVTSDGNGNFITTNDAGWSGLQSQQFTDMVNLAHENNVRVVLTIKIFNLQDIESVVDSTTNSQNLINNTINLVKQYNLQGVNIDFEYNPTTDGVPNTTTINNFTTFMQNMTSTMHSSIPGSYISVDVVAGAAKWSGSLYDIPALANASDAIDVMAYDYYSSKSSISEPTAPFSGYNNGTGPLWYDVKQTIKDFTSVTSPNKIVILVPYYSYDYATTSLNQNAQTISGTAITEPYGQTNDQYKNASTMHWDSTASAPWYGYCYPSNNTPPNCASTDQMREGYYSSPEYLSQIYNEILDYNLRGVGFWTLGDQEPATELWQTEANYFINNSTFSSINSAYYLLSGHGKVLTFGNAEYYGDMTYIPNAPDYNSLKIAPLPDDSGYYILTTDGGIYTFGSAKFYGSVYDIPNAPIKTPIDIKVTPDGKGYYVLTADGGVYTFGDAQFYGSLFNIPASALPDKTPVSLTLTKDGKGYYITTSNGSVYTFGDAYFYGSVFNIPNAPIKNTVIMSLTADGCGYYLITTDGGVYTFGDASFYGSMYNIKNAPVTTPIAFEQTEDKGGYYLITKDGGVYTFGDAVYDGTGISTFNSTSDFSLL